MMKRLGTLFLAVLILSGSLSAQGAQYRCQGVFRQSVGEVLRDIDRDNQGFLFKNDLQSFREDLSWNRKRKLRKLLNNTYLGDSISERSVTRLAAELSLLLFGRREVVDNLIFKTEGQRLSEAAVGLTQEKLLREGLLNSWGEYSPETVRGLSGFVKSLRWTGDRLLRVHEYIGGTFLSLPLFLPTKKNLDISSDLMQKIILEGVDKHIAQVRIELKAQTDIEAYNTFRRLYTPIFFGSVVTIISAITYMMAVEENDRIVNEQLANLEKMKEQVSSIGQAKEQIIENAYQDARDEFIQRWGEPPTAAEAVELRAKVTNGILKKKN